MDSYEVAFSYQGPCSGFNHTNTTTVDGTTRQYTLTGLQFSNYTVTVVAVNGAGRSEESSVNVVTLPDSTYVGVQDILPSTVLIITYFRPYIQLGQHGIFRCPGAVLHMPANCIVWSHKTCYYLHLSTIISLLIQTQLNNFILAFEFYGIQ